MSEINNLKNRIPMINISAKNKEISKDISENNTNKNITQSEGKIEKNDQGNVHKVFIPMTIRNKNVDRQYKKESGTLSTDDFASLDPSI